MNKIEEILKTIDTTKMERKMVDIYEMCENQFDIYEWLNQSEDNVRLTYCFFHKWLCTDTEVGIKVWYFDDKPVCISWQPYRKSTEKYGWLSENDFRNVQKYLTSLRLDDTPEFSLANSEIIVDVIEKFNKIDYKKFEERNIK